MTKKPFKETKLGSFLKDKAPHVLNIVGDVLPDKGLLGIVKNIISKDEGIPPEVKAEFDKLAADHEKEIFALEVQDRASAREMNAQLNDSEYASWLSKNTASLIALIYTCFSIVLYILILVGHLKANENIAILIVNSVTNIIMLIVGFYYGSSERRRMQENRSIK